MLIDAEKMSGSNHRKLLMAQPRWNRGLKRLGIALLLFIFCTVWIFIKHDFYHLKKFFLSPRIYVMVFNYPTTFRCFTLILWQYHRYADEPLKLDLNLIGFKTLNSFRFRNSWLALFIMEWLERSSPGKTKWERGCPTHQPAQGFWVVLAEKRMYLLLPEAWQMKTQVLHHHLQDVQFDISN